MPYDRILDLMTLPGHPNVYLLGVYAKRLTVYSQQIRAVNLIDAIHWYRRPLEGVRVAIVGGGASGITAAARAVQYGARTTLIELLQNVLEIQRNSERWLHPTLFEWPIRGLDPAEETTKLPVMNWTAGTAAAVANTLSEQWTSIRGKGVDQWFNSQVTSIDSGADGGSSVLRWRQKTKDGEDKRESPFDAVIFAVGFGLEPKGVNRRSYWENDSLNKTLREDECVLIAGYGDGALTDLMRASLNNFDHRTLLTSIVSAVSPEDLKRVKDIETDRGAKYARYLSDQYRRLEIPAIQSILRPNLNAIRKVVLTGQGPDLFDPRASALNRMITAQLLQLKAFEHVPLGDGERIGTADSEDKVLARLEREAGRPFTDMVLRFGVERTITKIDGISASAEELRGVWDKIQPNDDPTRIRLWELLTPINHDVDHSIILFLAPESNREFVDDIVRRAVEDVSGPDIQGLCIVPITECFRSDEALLHTVRALCRAPVAIFPLGEKIGNQNVGTMLLLGIRAAVRRGPTLVVREGSLTPADWSSLPFNLKEVQIYPLDSVRRLESANRLAKAIREGLSALNRDAQGYRDTPVFDIVRRPKRRTDEPAAKEHEVFVLCSFAEIYDDSWQKLQLWLDGKDDRKGGSFSLKRVIDYSSPLLAGERLYELTRHAGSCIVDWTHWSPNVFFEMGVRLAVASVPPICLLRYSTEVPDGVPSQLLERFTPLIYQAPGQTGENFRDKFLSRLSEPKLQASTVYAAAERNLFLKDEYGGATVYEQLFSTVNAMLGTNLASVNLLYGRNDPLHRQIFQSGADALMAARLLIEHKLGEQSADIDGSRLTKVKAQIDSLLREVEQLMRQS